MMARKPKPGRKRVNQYDTGEPYVPPPPQPPLWRTKPMCEGCGGDIDYTKPQCQHCNRITPAKPEEPERP